MPSDRTRTSDDLAQQYQAVVLQQGRVLLDRDFNALQEIVSGQSAADALDEVGPCGTPDNGFAVSLPAGGASFSASAADFAVAHGTMYVGGRRVWLPLKTACTAQKSHLKWQPRPASIKPMGR